MQEDIKDILITQEELKEICSRLGKEISKDYEGKNPVILVILKGSAVFASDLIRSIGIPVTLDFMRVSSYGNSTESSGSLKILQDIDYDISGRDVIIVEDIVDSGLTLSTLRKMLEERGADVSICTCLSKPSRRKADVDIRYLGREIPDEFIVGYGLDFAEKYRNLPYIGILKREIYENQ